MFSKRTRESLLIIIITDSADRRKKKKQSTTVGRMSLKCDQRVVCSVIIYRCVVNFIDWFDFKKTKRGDVSKNKRV